MTKMNKTFLVSVLIILLLIALLATVIQLSGGLDAQIMMLTCRARGTDQEISTCIYTWVIVKNRPNLCEKAFYSDQEDWCYYNIAEEHTSPLMCDRIKTLQTREMCYLDMAKNLTAPYLCMKMQQQNDINTCLYNVEIIANKSNQSV